MLVSIFAFAGAATLLIVMPGPDSMLVLRNAVRSGRRAGAFTAVGTLTGLVIWAALAAVGLAAVLAASEVAYEVVTVAGALYLLWMGVKGLLASRRTTPPELNAGATRRAGRKPAADPPPFAGPPAVPASLTPTRGFVTGMMTNLLNPKVGIFFMSFLPGFVPSGSPVGTVSMILGTLFVVETAVWLFVILLAAGQISSWLRRPTVKRRFEQVTSLILVGFGIRVVVSS